MSDTKVQKMKSGIYRCPDNIKNLKISVKLKKLHSTSANCDSDIDLNMSEKEAKIFFWQGKVFSRTETEFYAKDINCVTELDKQYHEMVVNGTDTPGRLFSYVQNDGFNPNDEIVTTEINPVMSKLHTEISELRFRKKIKDTSKNINVGYEINKFLNNSITNPFTSNCYESMYVMADLGDSEANSNSWIKSEHILCSLKYDEEEKLLWIYPDFSRNKNEPYILEIDVGVKLIYEYFIENISNLKSAELIKKENDILKKINKKNQESIHQLFFKDFSVPLRNTLRFYLFFEIMCGRNFEYDNIYIEYFIDLPENWKCDDENSLFGTTPTCKTRGIENVANFGHHFELCLEYKMQKNDLISSPQIFFQVLSRDFWDRYRNEGLSYKFLPIFEPGTHDFKLQCIRICPKIPVGELRRFFIGDYFNINDMTWIGLPTKQQGNTINKYGVPTIGTGTIDVRINIMHQMKGLRNVLKDGEVSGILQRLNSSNLVKSISEVLSAYKKAKEKMARARENILQNEE